MGRHLTTFTRQPGSSLYTLTTVPPPVAESGQVATLGQVFAVASRTGLESAPCSCRLLSHQTHLWHHRLGHPSLPRLRGMASRVLVTGLPPSLPPLPSGLAPTCVPCVEGRQCATPHSSEFPPTEAPLQTLHMDVTEVLIDWIRAARCQLSESFGSDLPVLRLHFDIGGEFSYDLLRAFCRAEGIRLTLTLPASPQQNGIAERRIGMVMDVARTSMIHAAAPHFLWPFAVQYAAHQINLQPWVSVPETTPTLRWTGKVGEASAFRVWGSRDFVRDLSADKLSSRAVPYVFLGFLPDAPGWQFYHPTSRRVLSSQDLMFNKSVPYYGLFPYRTATLPPPLLFLAPDAVEPVEVAIDSGAARVTESVDAGSGGTEPKRAEPGGAESGGAEPWVAESGGAEPEGAEPMCVESGGAAPGGPSAVLLELVVLRALEVLLLLELLGVLEPNGPGRACTGGTGAARPGGAARAGAAGGAEAGGTIGPGATRGAGPSAAGAAEASSGPGGAGAGGAAGAGAPGGAGVGASGAPRDYAASLVAESAFVCPPSVGGECTLSTDVLEDMQEEFQCFPAALPHVVSMLLAPEGDPDAPDIPTPRSYAEAITGPYSSQWETAMDAEMASWKSTGTYVDEVPPPEAKIVSSMWIFKVKRPTGSPPVFKLSWVADHLGQSTGHHYLDSVAHGAAGPSAIQLHVLQATPLSTRHSLSALPLDESVEPSGPYPKLVGCLMYLMTCTQPNLAYPLSILARYVAPGRHRPEHMDAAKRVLRCLCSTMGMGLVLGGRARVVLTGNADASWVDDLATQRSSQGYTLSLGSGSVSWRSIRLSSVLSSSCEAEIYAVAMAAQELRWLTYLLADLGEAPRSPPVLYVDNKVMLALCQEHRLEHRTKHIALRYFLARELQLRGQLRLAYVATRANTADIFTKAL
ncbi:unnamed protein product [Closterium sp. NIES-54]